jgi:hypothetical protein
MKRVVQELRTKYNVHTIPYVNGRLFDPASHSYTHPAGTGDAVSCTLPVEPALGPFRRDQLVYATEKYETPIHFHIADPSDPWWQNKYRDNVDELVNGLGVDGVYIDQLAAAGPMLDFSPGRSHGLGGGAWWSAGIAGMLAAIQTKTDAPVAVEGNAEDKLGVVQAMLVPSSFGVAFARNGTDGDLPGNKHGVHAPAFAAVYGGYSVFFGAIYGTADLIHPDFLCAKLAVTFCAGTQVGWFDVGGVVGAQNFDLSCGATGELGLWMDPERDPEVDFVRLIARSRALVRDFVAFGRLGHPPIRVGAPVPIFSAPAGAGFDNKGPFPTLSAAVWIAPNGTSAVLLLVTATHDAVVADYDLDPKWYLICPDGRASGYTAVSTLRPNGERSAVERSAPGDLIKVRLTVPGRDVVMVHLECARARGLPPPLPHR